MKHLFLITLLASSLFAQAQDAVRTADSLDVAYFNWQNKDLKTDKIMGMSVEKTYQTLIKDKKPAKTIIVAVIDGGVDIKHEDLAGKIWVNEKEIAQNGKDDDGNGYIDDIHGWNFMGNAQGENYSKEVYEYVRIYRDLLPTYGELNSTDGLNEKQKAEYARFKDSEQKLNKEREEYSQAGKDIAQFEMQYKQIIAFLANETKVEVNTKADLAKVTSSDKTIQEMVKYLEMLFDNGFSAAALEEYKKDIDEKLNFNLNPDFNPRAEVVGDDVHDISQTNYGNADVKGPTSEHGTMVAGMITANRTNQIGTLGVAEGVKIMALRAVPNGDEYDKDIALAIRYATDNGAHIINMSFGKGESPDQWMVQEALQYASDKGVLLVHAAGNDSKNLDVEPNFPSPYNTSGNKIPLMLTIGASAKEKGKEMAASFSNYGKKTVDIFAPGEQISTTYPENKYKLVDGTSFAAPAVSGVAALVWSYYPELTVQQLKEILLRSGYKAGKQKVIVPGGDKKDIVKFASLSETGNLVNAYQAFIMAEKMNTKK
ncbi:S8 family peptidase [Cytophagales bacterium LB-30]|uniref:S8 family peptidase n=1 Tax=Shiella aurantiaca TaxID=3058365 RepID=A0ABT8F4F3_9BACT|nr:S8 family peptidase [Shiella aurantiaca]MDN4165342.1 S8 family peptidase [Shiella aurantiaca]